MPVDATPRSTVNVRLATLADAPAVRAIYNVEVNEYTSTFDLVPRTLDQQRTWLAERSGAFSAVVATLDADPGQIFLHTQEIVGPALHDLEERVH